MANDKKITASQPSINRLNSLDGLRGWAALTVVLGHLTCNIAPFNSLQSTPFTDTKLAVGVFFVISGFVLSYRFIGHHVAILTLLKAFIARYARLTIPIAVVSFLVLLFGFHLSLFYSAEAQVAEPTWGFGSFYLFQASLYDTLKFSLWDVYLHYDSNHSYIPPSWTMGLELRGSYFIYAIVFLVGLRNHWPLRRPGLILIAALAIAAYHFHYHWSAFFLSGYLLAEFYKNSITSSETLPKVRIAFPVFIMLMMLSSARSPERSLLLPMVGVSLVLVWSVLYSPALSAFFSNPWSQFLGKISFPLYLIHVPIYCTFSSWLITYLYSIGFNQLQMYSIVFFSSVALALMGAYFLYPIELFAIQVSRRINRFSLGQFHLPIMPDTNGNMENNLLSLERGFWLKIVFLSKKS